jgi:peptide/nickel transport system permease protein
VLRRLVAAVVLCFLLSVLVFVGTQVLPGDAAQAVLGRNANPEAVEQVRAELELDRPVVGQYTSWLGGILRADPGESLAARRPVADLIAGSVINTIILAGVTLAVLIPLALVLGVLAGVRPGRSLDHLISGGTLILISLPEFVIGTLLALALAVELGWLPPVSIVPPGESPLQNPEILVLPALTLVLVGLAYTVRMVRAGVAEAMEREFVHAARLNGVPERRLVWRYVLPNALAPAVAVIALTMQWTVGGAVIVETVFQYPGMGLALVQAVSVRDIPTVQAVALLIGVTYVLINLAADIVTLLLVPRLRTSL